MIDVLQLSEPPLVERRGAVRTAVRFPVALDRADFAPMDGWALDVSASGMLVRTAAEPAVWCRLVATLPAIGRRDVRVVRRDGDRYGCLFAEALEPEELDSLLASPEAEAGFAQLRVEAACPPPSSSRRGMLRLWRR